MRGLPVRRLAVFVVASLFVLLVVIMAKGSAAPAEAAAVVRDGGTLTSTGPKIALTHGIVQVRVTIADGRITDCVALSLPHDNPHSWAGSSGAAVKLRAEVLARQSGDIQMVSGATYTSGGYIRSLQAALDAAGHR
jgi:uncharacterized protein with FMN-binding domain